MIGIPAKQKRVQCVLEFITCPFTHLEVGVGLISHDTIIISKIHIVIIENVHYLVLLQS